jgi:hypothetical protein
MLMLDTNERRRTWTQSDDNISSEPLDEVTSLTLDLIRKLLKTFS